MSSKALSLQIKSIGDQLSKKALAASQTSCADHPTECIDLLNNLKKITVIGAEKDDKSETPNRGITISILNETKIGLSLNKLLKSFRRFRRSNDNDSGNQWRDCMDISQQETFLFLKYLSHNLLDCVNSYEFNRPKCVAVSSVE